MTHAQLVWAIVPPDCKQGMAELDRLGLREEAGPEVLEEAADIVERIPEPWTPFVFTTALDMAAKNYLERKGLL